MMCPPAEISVGPAIIGFWLQGSKIELGAFFLIWSLFPYSLPISGRWLDLTEILLTDLLGEWIHMEI